MATALAFIIVGLFNPTLVLRGAVQYRDLADFYVPLMKSKFCVCRDILGLRHCIAVESLFQLSYSLL
jgi:hypothetical protein